MRITPCPICGREPKITECRSFNNIRRRSCHCPELDSVIPYPDNLNKFGFIYIGNGDDNAIFKLWNLAIQRYQENKPKDWFDRDFSRWSNDSHITW